MGLIADHLTDHKRAVEARQLRSCGLNCDGSIAEPWFGTIVYASR